MLLFFFELLSGCCYVATSVPRSVPKETAIAPCRNILKSPVQEILSPVMSCPNYSCWFWRSGTPRPAGMRGDDEVGFIVGGGCGEHQTRIISM